MSFGTMMRRQFRRSATIHIDGTVPQVGQKLAALPEAQKAKVRFIYGHMPFGLHTHLPEGAVYVTMLRNPVDRIVSVYYYALRRPEWGVRDEIIGRRMSLHDFAISEAASEFNNGQTRLVSGSDDRMISSSALESAIGNLRQHFVVAGLMERFDESVLLCRELLGWRRVYYRRRNVNRRRVRLEDVPRETIAAIERTNSLDLELYEIAARRFDELVGEHPAVGRDLERFRRLNRVYSMVGNAAEMAVNLPVAAFRRIRV
jgi:hypothetical protein